MNMTRVRACVCVCACVWHCVREGRSLAEEDDMVATQRKVIKRVPVHKLAHIPQVLMSIQSPEAYELIGTYEDGRVLDATGRLERRARLPSKPLLLHASIHAVTLRKDEGDNEQKHQQRYDPTADANVLMQHVLL